MTLSKVVCDLQRSGIKRSRLESPGRWLIEMRCFPGLHVLFEVRCDPLYHGIHHEIVMHGTCLGLFPMNFASKVKTILAHLM